MPSKQPVESHPAGAPTQGLPPLLLTTDEDAGTLRITRAHFHRLHLSGRLGVMPTRLGRCVRWNREDLEGWCRAGCPCRERWLVMKETMT